MEQINTFIFIPRLPNEDAMTNKRLCGRGIL